MDRVCGIIGAKYLANLMLINSDLIITVDCGTASTINVLYKNSFIGGMIAPGISTMFSSLNKNTSLLPDLDLENYENLIGDSTEASIVSGVVNSTIGYIERCVAQIEKIYKTKATVFITGGNCIKLLNYLDTSINYEKDLVLIGVNEVSVRTTVRGF
jgi:type III pantothenate kinase